MERKRESSRKRRRRTQRRRKMKRGREGRADKGKGCCQATVVWAFFRHGFPVITPHFHRS